MMCFLHVGPGKWPGYYLNELFWADNYNNNNYNNIQQIFLVADKNFLCVQCYVDRVCVCVYESACVW